VCPNGDKCEIISSNSGGVTKINNPWIVNICVICTLPPLCPIWRSRDKQPSLSPNNRDPIPKFELSLKRGIILISIELVAGG
jgi:hypothetical protein